MLINVNENFFVGFINAGKISLSGSRAMIPQAVTEGGGMDDFLILHISVL